MKNAFGLELPQIKDIVTDLSARETVSTMILQVLTYLEIPADRAKEIIRDCLYAASSYTQLETYEAEAHQILETEKVAQRIPEKLSARASLMYSQIAPYLLAGTVLDYGCGDGQVAELITKNRKQTVALTDVYEHKHIKEAGLGFKLFRQGAKAPFGDAEFDNVLALTVFHHSSNPLESIKDVARLTKSNGRVLVVESVYGVNGAELPEVMKQKIGNYLALSAEQQRKVNIFFDHFYNRIIHYSTAAETKVNVPFNFNTPENWQQIFAGCGLEQEMVIHLGLDQPTAPEYHTLHVLRKLP